MRRRPSTRACRKALAATLLPVVLSCGRGSPAAAQEADAERMEVGDTIRFRLPGALRVGGSFHGWRADVMLIGVDGIEQDWPVSLFDVAALDLYTERTPREGLRYFATLGAVSGLFVGAGVGLTLRGLGVIDAEGEAASEVMAVALRWSGLGVVGGGLTGAVYGSRRPGRGWVGIKLPGS